MDEGLHVGTDQCPLPVLQVSLGRAKCACPGEGCQTLVSARIRVALHEPSHGAMWAMACGPHVLRVSHGSEILACD